MSQLVLTVSPGQSVVIGPPSNPIGRVVLTNKVLSGGRVRLLFDFPTSVPINREAVAEVKVAEVLVKEGNPS